MRSFIVAIAFLSVQVVLGQKKSEKVDPTSFNKEFLVQCILEELNSRKQINLESNKSLADISEVYQLTYEAKHFYASGRYQTRIDKELSLKTTEQLKYEGSLVVSVVSSIDMIDYQGGDFHYHRADKLSTLHLFYGERTKLNQIEEKLIPFDTYQTLSKKIVDQNLTGVNKKVLKSSAYKDIGVSVALDYKTLYRSKIPQIKVIMVLGGNQTALLKDLTN